ncbi:MAG: hypothetical protein ACFCVG_09090 [Kineosporiaceae bacterium]
MRPSAPARPRTAPPVLAAAVLTGALSLAATALAGCGGYDGGYGDDGSTAPAAAAPAASASDTEPGSEPGSGSSTAPTLAIGEAADVGQVTVDGAGFTLYRFDSDTADPPGSACDGDCAQAWPPVTVDDASALVASGIDADLLGTLTRDDGSVQVTLAGWPLYRYAEDSAPGDALGHGVGGTWFAATPTGERAGAAAGAGDQAPEDDAPASDGYGSDY